MMTAKESLMFHYRKAAAVAAAFMVGLAAASPAAQSQTPPGPASGSASATLSFNAEQKPAAKRAEVSFTAYKSAKDLTARIPAAEEIYTAFGPAGEELVTETGKAASLADGMLVLFYLEGAGQCGALGCSLIGFSLGQDGYYPSLNLTVGLPVRTATAADGTLSLFVCNPEGEQVEWQLAGTGQFEPVAQAAGHKRLACTDPAP